MLVSAWLLLLAMLLAQTMGFVHGAAHVHLPRSGQIQPGAIAADQAGSVAAALELLFDDHNDEAQCRLYDQMSRGDCAPTADRASTASAPLAAAPVGTTLPAPCGNCLPARARGPPLAG